jgi:ankyrin repeat protein
VAAEGGHGEILEIVLDRIPEAINFAAKNGKTALLVAAEEGHKEVCELLIPRMTSEAINAVGKSGETALHWAAWKGHKEVCELILQMIPEAINAVHQEDNTALHFAAGGGHKEVYTILIDIMPVRKIVELLRASSNESPIQNMLNKIIVSFIAEKFSGNKYLIDFNDCYQVKLLKLYQIINQDVLKKNLNAGGNSALCINKANNYIEKHYFTLIGVCKSIGEDNPLSILAVSSDCMPHVLSYLEPHSLIPELFPCVELMGEGVEAILKVKDANVSQVSN